MRQLSFFQRIMHLLLVQTKVVIFQSMLSHSLPVRRCAMVLYDHSERRPRIIDAFVTKNLKRSCSKENCPSGRGICGKEDMCVCAPERFGRACEHDIISDTSVLPDLTAQVCKQYIVCACPASCRSKLVSLLLPWTLQCYSYGHHKVIVRSMMFVGPILACMLTFLTLWSNADFFMIGMY